MNDARLGETATLRDVIAAIERTRRFIAVVVDESEHLLGTVSDGDVRRAIMAGHTLDTPVLRVMNPQPKTARAEFSDAMLMDAMAKAAVAAMPLVDEANRFVRVVLASDLKPLAPSTKSGRGFAAAVVMAGGEGRRLQPLTNALPKPMLPVGNEPLLQRLIRSLVRADIRRILITTNYLAHIIEGHFGDGAALNAEISYIREPRKLGTAGALALLPTPPSGPLLVVNGDIITESDYGAMFDYHMEQEAELTVGAVEYHVDIPFGVLEIENTRLIGIAEKPSQRFLCNAGIYVVSPGAWSMIPRDRQFDMTDLIGAVMQAGREVAVFPIHEYWTDIGNPADLDRVRRRIEGAN